MSQINNIVTLWGFSVTVNHAKGSHGDKYNEKLW